MVTASGIRQKFRFEAGAGSPIPVIRKENAMEESKASVGRSIKVGVITDQTGPLSVMGIANANRGQDGD